MPWPLKDRCEARARELGYSNLGRYFTSLASFDLICQRPHKYTCALANASPAEQDALIDGLVRIKKPGWIEHVIAEVAGEMSPEQLDEFQQRLAVRIQWQLVEDGMAA